MAASNLVALRAVPAVAASRSDAITVGALQRWCAQANAQMIFNCDGTIYAACGEDIRHTQYGFDTLAEMISQADK